MKTFILFLYTLIGFHAQAQIDLGVVTYDAALMRTRQKCPSMYKLVYIGGSSTIVGGTGMNVIGGREGERRGRNECTVARDKMQVDSHSRWVSVITDAVGLVLASGAGSSKAAAANNAFLKCLDLYRPGVCKQGSIPAFFNQDATPISYSRKTKLKDLTMVFSLW